MCLTMALSGQWEATGWIVAAGRPRAATTGSDRTLWVQDWRLHYKPDQRLDTRYVGVSCWELCLEVGRWTYESKCNAAIDLLTGHPDPDKRRSQPEMARP